MVANNLCQQQVDNAICILGILSHTGTAQGILPQYQSGFTHQCWDLTILNVEQYSPFGCIISK